jgi:pyruvate dehydrogenase E2 component (dihydrolipoamide acetyltransferase)
MVESATAQAVVTGLKGEVTVIEPDRAERAIARRSAEVRATVPTMEFATYVTMDNCMELEAELGCGLIALLVRAAAHALRTVPRMNGAYRDGKYELYSRVNVGVTLIDDGIYTTPTVFDADRKAPLEIATELAGFYERAGSGELHPSETAGATFTVVDSTAFDIASLSPMIIAPQAGAMAVGPVRDVPVLRDGKVVPGQTMAMTLSVDHRIVHGRAPATFLEDVKAHLEEARA